MRYAFVDVLLTLVVKALPYRFILVEPSAMSQALELNLLELLLDLAEGQFNRVELR